MIYTIKSKLTKSGAILNLFGSKKGNYFANGKRYWIEFGNGDGRRAINRSDSLSYLQKKFDEIN